MNTAPVRPPAHEGSFAQLAASVAAQLSAIWDDRAHAVNERAWEAAHYYVTTFATLRNAWEEEHKLTLTANRDKAVINRAIRQQAGYHGPGGTWLSDAKRTHDMLTGRARAGTRTLPYDFYRQIVVCSLTQAEKEDLLAWAEEEKPPREGLRLRIRTLVDAKIGISRPDFDLKFGNVWRFNEAIQANGFDGGIHPDLVANLLYYCTKPGDVVIDPMAGGDTTYRVTQQYRYFQETRPEMNGSGPRTVLRADIAPTQPDILQADITHGSPWPSASADFCLLDPPYFKVAQDKYGSFGETISDWCENVRRAVHHAGTTLKSGGLLAIVTDDYLRKDEFHPLSLYASLAAIGEGFTPHMVFYDPYPNFLAMSALEMARYKKAKTVLNGMKVIAVFRAGRSTEKGGDHRFT